MGAALCEAAAEALSLGDAERAAGLAEAALAERPDDLRARALHSAATMLASDGPLSARLAAAPLDEGTVPALVRAALHNGRPDFARGLVSRAMAEAVARPATAMAQAHIALFDGDREAARAILIVAAEAYPEAEALGALLSRLATAAPGDAAGASAATNRGAPPRRAEETPPQPVGKAPARLGTGG